MLYVIPFIILLAIAILLKKREDPNKDKSSDKTKKTASKKTSKKTNKEADPAPQKQPVAISATEKAVLESHTPTTVDDKFKQSIEQMIKSRTFYSAEAKINQALNQDSSQHELYLYLVDIHLAQNDEFAIKQLVNYVRSLGLNDIADRAEEKQRNYVPEQIVEPAPVEEEIVETQPEPEVNQKVNKAFDALIIDNDTSSFDSLQSDLTGENKEKEDDLKVFNFYETDATPQSAQPTETTSPEPEIEISTASSEEQDSAPEIPTLEFSFTESANSKKENEGDEQAEDQLSFTNKSLDFNLSQPAQIEVQEPEIQIEEFVFEEKVAGEATPLGSETSFKLDIPTSTPEATELSSNTLEFNLDVPSVEGTTEVASTILAEAPLEFVSSATALETSNDFVLETPAEEPKLEFAFDTTNTVSNELEFKVEEPIAEVASIEPADLEFSPSSDSALSFTETPTLAESPLADVIEPNEAASINDPLAASYPEVVSIDEVDLDLQLAEQYIQLGAYESAKELLTRNESKFSAEQREHSENLLNKIAS
jgi:hypothetical protein